MKNNVAINKYQVLATEVLVSECTLWHKKLGHASSQVLKYLHLLKNNIDSSESINNYSVYPLAK